MSNQIPPVIDKAITRLLFDHPFFAVQAMSTPVEMDERFPVAATNGKKIFFNPKWIEKNPKVSHVTTVAAHEVSHNAFLHHSRQEWREAELWNAACDYEINGMLKDQKFEPPPCGWLQDDKYEGMSAEKIYDELMKNPPPPQDGSGDGDDPGGTGDQPGGKGKPGSGAPHNPMGQDLAPMEGGDDPAERAKTVRAQKQRVAMAANQARMMGKLKGELARMVDEYINPKVPWHVILREYMLRIFKDEESWMRRNRRYRHVYLPARHSERMGPIGIIGDSSGSIWCQPHELEQFAAEIQAVADLVQPEHIRLIWADTKVAGEEVFEQGETLRFEVKGGGGTDMRVPLKHMEQYEPEVVILLTDGYTPWPSQEPPYPLIVCCSTDADCPVGEVIRL